MYVDVKNAKYVQERHEILTHAHTEYSPLQLLLVVRARSRRMALLQISMLVRDAAAMTEEAGPMSGRGAAAEADCVGGGAGLGRRGGAEV